jgi:uncharacterized protein
MSLFALADPHLGFAVDKPMAIFGSRWLDHENRLAENWRQAVGPDDTAIIPGDISWAMRLDDALPDLRFLDSLPGRKILARGNHDYWWPSLTKLEQFCRDNGLTTLSFLHNNAILVPPDWIICGTRGWILPDDPAFGPNDQKIYQREAGRFQLSLDQAAAMRQPGWQMVACFHFPPFGGDGKPTLFTNLMTQYGVDRCIFGHIHGLPPGAALAGPRPPVAYNLVSADYIDFKPLRL